MTHECTCNEKFRTAEDYRDHLPCGVRSIEEVERKYIALIKDYSESLVRASAERDRYKQALERIINSTSGTFRSIARDALNANLNPKDET